MKSGIIGRRKRILFLISLFVLILFFYWQNNDIVITDIKCSNKDIPISFDGFKILHVSDLHNKEFGKNQSGLMKLTKKMQPDIIVITGDLIDSNCTDIEIAMEYAAQAIKIAPIYFVTGNHEKWCGVYPELRKRLEQSGIVILDNRRCILNKGNESIALLGLSDPEFIISDIENGQSVDAVLESVSQDVAIDFKILLSHRPELIDLYAKHEIDLVFSGHAHGGQFRIPLLGGLYAPNQGFFPKYTNGVIVKEKTSMVVSRGLGNSVIPVRIFNRPELVLLTLEPLTN